MRLTDLTQSECEAVKSQITVKIDSEDFESPTGGYNLMTGQDLSHVGVIYITGFRAASITEKAQAVLNAAVKRESCRNSSTAKYFNELSYALDCAVRAYYESLKPSPSIDELETALNKACDELKKQALSGCPVDQYVVDDYNTKSREYHAALCRDQERMKQEEDVSQEHTKLEEATKILDELTEVWNQPSMATRELYEIVIKAETFLKDVAKS